MHLFRAVVVASAFVLFGGQEALAQTQPQYEALMRWAAGHQRVIQETVAPLQQLPDPYVEAGRAERMAWVARAQSWISAYRVSLASARQHAEQLGPVPEAGDVSTLYANQERVLPELFDSLAHFLTQYENGVRAIERNDPQAMRMTVLAATDAQLLIQTQFRNLNALQAEATEEGPQKYLLRSFAGSYDALIAVLRARRASYLGEDASAASAVAAQAAAEAIRQHTGEGRRAAQAAEASLPAQVPPEQSDFLRRVRLAFQSFEASFDREDQLAEHISAVALLLASGRAFTDKEVELEQLLARIGRLDYERLGDIQRRTFLVQMVMPPT